MTMARDLRHLCWPQMSYILATVTESGVTDWEFECGSEGIDFEVVGL